MEVDRFDCGMNEILGLHEEVTLAPLMPLPALPWRSLGGFFNYEAWPGRERFLLLDREIEVSRSAHLTQRRSSRNLQTGISSHCQQGNCASCSGMREYNGHATFCVHDCHKTLLEN
jgi:hypothetical protein